MYIVLIGSVSQNEFSENSDIDICRIGTFEEVNRRLDWPSGPVNYIDYTYDDFIKLYNQGSLFIYHIMHDGVLLKGNSSKWLNLVNQFKFIDTYGEEADELREIILELLDIKIYGGTYLSFYSNIFTLLKNFSIFTLAHNNIFEFNKQRAFTRIFDEKYFDILFAAYCIFERNICQDKYNYEFNDENHALEIASYIKKELRDENVIRRNGKKTNRNI